MVMMYGGTPRAVFFSFKIGHDMLAYFSPVLRAMWNQALGVLRFFDVLVKLWSYTDRCGQVWHMNQNAFTKVANWCLNSI
jgi:hypothetical protein